MPDASAEQVPGSAATRRSPEANGQAEREREFVFHRRVAFALVMFPITSGALDAAGFLGLHEVFTANMTGNSALLAIALARGSSSATASSATGLVGFCLGAALGTLTRAPANRGHWLARVAVPITIGAGSLLALTFGWVAAGTSPAGWTAYALILAAALAMGLQSAANRPSALRNVPTTYMTGTITRAVESAVTRLRPSRREPQVDPGVRAGVWILYLGGAATGAFAELRLHGWSIAIPAALTTILAALSWHAALRERASRRAGPHRRRGVGDASTHE